MTSTDLSKWTIGYRLVDSEASHGQRHRDLLRHPIDLTEHNTSVRSLQAQLPHLIYRTVRDISRTLIGRELHSVAGAYNRTFPCMEATYPYAIKNQRGASKKPLVGGFGCEELVLYGLRDSSNSSEKSSTSRWTTLLYIFVFQY